MKNIDRNDGVVTKSSYGFTLLELLISVGLTSILMAALFSAMSIYLRLQVDSHEEITRHQVTRSLLRQMTRDIQSVVFVKEKASDADSSSKSSKSSGSGSSGSGTAGSSSSTGGTGTSVGSGQTGGTSQTGGSQTSGSGSSGSGTSGASGQSGSTGQSSGTSQSDDSGTTTAMLTYTSGLVGTANDLLLYVSSPDKSLSYVDAQSMSSTDERTGDLMIVRYLVADTNGGSLSASIAKKLGGSKTGPIGLVRITGDLFGMSNAVQSGKEAEFTSVDAVEAKEVTKIEFQYYDGTQWQATWDSTKQKALPTAIEIIMTMQNPEATESQASGHAPDPYAFGETKHRMVVALPLAESSTSETAL